MSPSPSSSSLLPPDNADVDVDYGQKDLCEHEQTQLLKNYVLQNPELHSAPSNQKWSANGSQSISPYSPCAATRIPHIFNALKLKKEDIICDLGCGDGRVLIEASCRYDCRVLGLEVDEKLIGACERNSVLAGERVCKNSSFALRNIMELPEDWFLNPNTELSNGKIFNDRITCCLIFITGHGLCEISPWLHKAWRMAGNVRVCTCVESLDTCMDYRESLFGEVNQLGWEVSRFVGERCGSVCVVFSV